MTKLACLTLVFILSLVGCGDNKDDGKLDSNHEVENEMVETFPIENEVDFSEQFDGIEGCAVFFNPDEQTYDVYNKAICSEQIPPYSTFKIISSLMGLSQGVVTSKDSTLGYDGTLYWRESWNNDLTFEQAFKESCVWYYEKLMSFLTKNDVQKTLNDLHYGNTDLSAWNDEGHHTFWISSSLKLCAFEQVNVLAKIFEGNSDFDFEDVNVVKDFMLVEHNENYSIYGKTGSAKQTNAWFTGFIEKDDKRTYFAVRVADESQELAGSIAKAIAFDIIRAQSID